MTVYPLGTSNDGDNVDHKHHSSITCVTQRDNFAVSICSKKAVIDKLWHLRSSDPEIHYWIICRQPLKSLIDVICIAVSMTPLCY